MNYNAPTAAELKAQLAARAAFLQTTRDNELRSAGTDEVVANILALDGFVVMTAGTQPERVDCGMQEQQRLFRLMNVAHRG